MEGEIDESPPIADAPAIPEGPAAPGSADAFIDDVNAGPQVAAPGGGELPDVDETLAEPAPTPDAVPGVPNSPPGASPPPIPGAPPAPGTPPAIPGAGGAVPGGPVTPEKVIGEQQKLEEDIARSKQAAAERESTASRQEAADQAAERQAEADRRAAIQLEVDKRNAAAQADIDKKTAFYEKNHELRDPRASQSTWDKVRMGIAVAFGGLGAAFSAAAGGSNKNMVLQQMTDNLDREQARQKANIENARDDVVVARANLAASQSQGRQQIADADDARRILIQDEDAKHVARLRVAEAQGRAELEAQGLPAAQINADSRIVQLQQARIAAERTAADDAAKRAEEAARAQYYLARGAQAAKKAKGGGGGGGGTAALEAMQAAANAPGATVLDVAIAGRKAHLSEKEALKQASVVWQRRTGDQRLGATDKRQLDREIKDFHGKEVSDVITARDRLETLKDKLSDPKVDPVTVMSSLMEFDKAVKGGTATKTSLDALLGHLGGLEDRMKGWLAHQETGNLAPGQIDIVRHAVDAGIKASNQEGARLAQSFDEKFRDNNDPAIAHERNSLFGRFGVKPAGAATGKKAPPEIIEQAKAEVARNGKYAASARKLLQQNGITP